MGQYIGVYLIQINNFPPILSIIGSMTTLIGMYTVRESYERENPTPKVNIAKLLPNEEQEFEEKKLRQFARQSSL